MKLSSFSLCILLPLLITAQDKTTPTASPRILFTPAGLTSVRYLDTELLARGSFEVNSITFRSLKGVVAGNTAHSTVTHASQQLVTLGFDWGKMSVRYAVKPSNLVMEILIDNRSALLLQALSLDVLALHLPDAPAEYDGVVPLLGTNIGAPTAIPLTYKGAVITLCNDDVRRPLLIGFPWALDKPLNRTFPLRITTGRDAMYPDSLPVIDRPVPPGRSDRYTLSLRFAAAPFRLPGRPPVNARVRPKAAGAAPSASARTGLRFPPLDVYNLFAKLYPSTISWPDRRPIGSLIIATAAAGWPKNPRGWLLDSKLDTTTPGGIAQFRTRLLAWADRSVVILKRMNAQGMVTWDIEGEQFPHATTYIGDPRIAETLAPEMHGVADEYFGRFRRAGLRVGVTIRPQTALVSEGGGAVKQVAPDDPAQVLIDKIEYARKRWGATLFYVDSNGDSALPLSFEVIANVMAAEPGVLLMPEHKNAAYYSKTAPYSELRGGSAGTPDVVRAIYRDAFSVINTADGPVDRAAAQLTAAVAQGDILMFRAWFDDPANAAIARIIRQVNAPASHSSAAAGE